MRQTRTAQDVFASCPKCKNPSALVLVPGTNAKATADWFRTQIQRNVDFVTASGWSIATRYPKAAERSVPEHTPDDVARVYRQADGMRRRQEFDGAAILYGKAIEIATKALDPAISGVLAARIDALAASGKLPAQVQSWAHEVRLVCNDAAHEAQEPNKDDVSEIGEFVEAFLEYVFTMPTKFANRQSQKSARATPK